MTRGGLRIAHVQPLSLDLYGQRDEDWGTAVRFFLPNMAIAQAAAGDRPTVHTLTSSSARSMDVDGVRVEFHRCLQPPRRLAGDRRFARQLSWDMVRALQRGAADVVHFHGARSLQPMLAAVAWRTDREGLPLVVQDHGPRPVGRTETALQSYGWRRATRFLAANAAAAAEYASWGVPAGRIAVVPNGVDPTVFRPAPGRSGPADPFHVLVVSRLWDDKDPLTMADGVALAAGAGLRQRATIVGGGPLRDEVVRRLAAGGVPVRVVERVPQEAMAEHYRDADALVLTSLREGFNQATLEAMSCGLPVVASDIPGIRDGVGDAGILVPPRSPASVADALGRLAADRSLWCSRRDAGLVRARAFAWPAIVADLDVQYRSAIREVRRG